METPRKIIGLEEGWEFMEKGITKLKRIFEGHPEPQFTSEEYMKFYETVYCMCTQKPPYDFSQQVYERYKKTFDEYMDVTVLPSIQEKNDEYMLRELVKRWNNHKVMVWWLSRFFHFLERYYICRFKLQPLNVTSDISFRELVYEIIKVRVTEAVITFINKEREGEQIDQEMLKNVLDIFVKLGMGKMNYYEQDFETALLEDTSVYYSRKVSKWIEDDSCSDYSSKVEECLKQEKDRVSHYLHISSEQKLLEITRHQLLSLTADKSPVEKMSP
ncbi:hypothetical protein IFM89_004064 [Coptis chinensis]|uniref:Cullin N-terminal domain-containing protein n=1 Tax=Coptis chinensis TaxID=261450 RepID=A0A835H368_9MAGN|nr:hypothetical protein IFM89_004064 [Coptis chinensis]